MSVTFYYMSGSQYSWRVWLALEHKSIPYVMKALSYDAGDLSLAEFINISPRRKVPVISDGDFSLYKSAAIVEFLEDNYQTGPGLFSKDVRSRAVQRRMIREIDQYFAAALDRLVKLVLLTSRKVWSVSDINAARNDLKSELQHWEQLISGNFLSRELSAVDFSLFPLAALLKRMNTRRPDTWTEDMAGPKFADWFNRMEQLDLVRRTWPPHW